MRELTFEVKEFIEQNIDLIDNGCWDQVYDNATFNLDSQSTGNFTQAMLDIGINPIVEQGLDYIPSYYLSDQNIKTFNIPDFVHELGEGCFSYSSIEAITIPESVTQLDRYVFYECPQLKEIIILGTDVRIEDGAIQYCHPDLKVSCVKGSPTADRLLELQSEDWSIDYL